MKNFINIGYVLIFTLLSATLSAFSCHEEKKEEKVIRVGAEQPEKYLPLLKDKRVGLVVNHTSLTGKGHLVDFLLQSSVEVVKIFAPEHGFRGEAGAGEQIASSTDKQTGLPVISLYGKNKKPQAEHLKDVDMLIFDIQDMGCRFYTYISTLHYVMEACAENNKALLVLDRPNPNGDYVDGPVLEQTFQSFVGMHPIPVVHGCTVGELARMINGEGWLTDSLKAHLKVIPVENYTHASSYELPVRPSPNLPNHRAVRLYPSLCFFEATSVSIGRGTPFPFQVTGYPNEDFGTFSFTPVSIPGVAVNPKQKDKICYGHDLRQLDIIPAFTLLYFMDYYHKFSDEKVFITSERWLNLLAGTGMLIKQIREGRTEAEIKKTWQESLSRYKVMRKRYLLYPDFE